MRTMKQVWVIVLLPFVGLVFMSSLVVGLLGLGNYRYDSSPASQFMNTSCLVLGSQVQAFSQFKSGYTTNCAPTVIKCYEVVWQVLYNYNVIGEVYSSGEPMSQANDLVLEYQTNNTYTCWYLPSGSEVSWYDWSATETDIQRAEHLMVVGFGTLISSSVLLLCFALCYCRAGRPELKPCFEAHATKRSYYENLPS